MNNETLNNPLSYKLRGISIILWFCALPFSTYIGGGDFQGYFVLLIGWLGFISGDFGWYANIFIFYLFTSFSNLNRKLIFPSICLLLISHSVYLNDSVIINANWSTTSIDGYGLGYILWFTSIYVLMIALGLRNQELYPQAKSTRFFLYGDIILLCANTLFTITKSAIDYTSTTPEGRSYLLRSGTVYKRISFAKRIVCTKNYQPKKFSQPVNALKIDVDTTHYFLPRFEWDWLFYNYKTIQVADYEYQRTNKNKTSYNELYQIQPISKTADAKLSLNYVGEEPTYELSAQLIDLRSNEILFDDTWNVALSSYSSGYGSCRHSTPNDFVKEAQTITHDNPAPYFSILSTRSYQASTEIIETSLQNKYNCENTIFQNCPSNIQFIEQENRPQFLLNIIDQAASSRLTTLLKIHKRYFLLRAITLSCNHKKIHLFDNSHIVTFDPESPADQLEYFITNIEKLPFRKGEIINIQEDENLLVVQFYDSDTQMINEVTFSPVEQK